MSLIVEVNPIVAFSLDRFGLFWGFVILKGPATFFAFFLYRQSETRVGSKKPLLVMMCPYFLIALTCLYFGIVVHTLVLLR